VTKDGQTTATALVPFAAGISISGINAENKKASVYQYTAWDPSDIVGTLTNASSSSAATSTATDYITVSNSSGTTTWTCVKAGVYRFSVDMYCESLPGGIVFLVAVLGGTATILIGVTGQLTISSSAADSANFGNAGTRTFYAVMTAGQTVTVLPKMSANGGAATTQYTTQCTVSAEYTGTS